MQQEEEVPQPIFEVEPVFQQQQERIQIETPAVFPQRLDVPFLPPPVEEAPLEQFAVDAPFDLPPQPVEPSVPQDFKPALFPTVELEPFQPADLPVVGLPSFLQAVPAVPGLPVQETVAAPAPRNLPAQPEQLAAAPNFPLLQPVAAVPGLPVIDAF